MRTSIILLILLAMIAGYVFFVQVRQTEESSDILHLTNLPGSSIGEFEIGDTVEVDFEEIRPGKFIPQFRMAK